MALSAFADADGGGSAPIQVDGVTMAEVSEVGEVPGVDGCPQILHTYPFGYETGTGWTVSDGAVGLWGPANPFTPAGDTTLCEIGVIASHVSGTNQYRIWLLPDAGGCPANPNAAIASWTISNLEPFGQEVSERVLDASDICLDGGTQYWLAMTADGGGTSWGVANWSTTVDLNRCNYNYDGTWTSMGLTRAGSWRVTGTSGCVDAQDMLAISWTGDVYRIDAASGGDSFVGASGYSSTNSMAKDPVSHRYYAASASQLITINPSNGAGALVANMSIADVRGMAFHPNGRLYAVQDQGFGVNDLLYTINTSTGNATFVGDIGFPGVQGLDFDKFGRLYGWDCGSGSGIGAGLITININNGAGTDVNPAVDGRCDEVQSMTFSPNGRLYGGNGTLYSISTVTGVLTSIGGSLSDIRGMEWALDPFLTVRGPCPGTITATVENCTPNRRVALEYGAQPGSFVIPGSFACAGITVNMGLPLLPGSPVYATANANGVATFSGPVGPNLCGRIRLQAIDAQTCATSNALIVN